jgi:hypothetical protein
LFAACTSGDPSDPGPKDVGGTTTPPGAAPSNGPFFHKDVEPILQRVCQNCHVAGGIAPFTLVTYDDARTNVAAIALQTKSRTMPPWGAQDTSECKPVRPWKDDLRLSDQEIATIAAWRDAGTPEGDPKDAPPPRATLTSGLAGATSIAPSAPFTLTTTSDTFRCFVLDPKITTDTYLNGTYFVPGNKTIVHHALAFSIPAGATAPGDAYDCFGGPQVTGASLVAAWAPGGVPSQYPDGVALPVTAGTKFVMQVHYHPHANATADPDATTFQFRTTSTAPTYIAKTALIGNFTKAVTGGSGLEPGPDDPPSGPEFRIPANAPAHVETMQFTMPAFGTTIWILGLGAHMHLAGKDEKITMKHGSDTSCLLQEPAWNFNWQRGYAYDAAIESLPTIAAGDVLEMRCTYDNTNGNVALAAARAESGITQPVDIKLGEQTTDEMCLGAFTFVYKAP